MGDSFSRTGEKELDVYILRKESFHVDNCDGENK